MQARCDLRSCRDTRNKARNEDRFKVTSNPSVITIGAAIAKGFSERFREKVVGKSKWAKEWNRIRERMARREAKKLKRGRGKNPGRGGLEHELKTLDVTRMSEKFHGRVALDEFDVDEVEVYDKNQAVLGDLVELNIIDPDKPSTEFTVGFKKDRPLLCCNAEGSQLEIIGGDQSLPFPNNTNKYLVSLGEIRTISYFTDKHHLEGPKNQKDGVEYEHEFGEEGGRLPMAVYNTRSQKILIVGGDYTIEEEGIAN